MDKIQENDYVRTQNGLIRKVDAIMTDRDNKARRNINEKNSKI